MATASELITQIYIGYYNRAPDPAGLSYWVGIYNSGKSLSDIAGYFSLQDESKATYPYLAAPGVADPKAFVTQIYQNLFNRAATADDLNYWVGELTGTGTDGKAGAGPDGKFGTADDGQKVSVGAFIATIQFVANTAGSGDDFTTLNNKTKVGLDYATKLANANVPFSQASSHDVIAGVTKDAASVTAGQTKTDAYVATGGGTLDKVLTTEGDTLTGNTFNAPLKNLSGQANVETLNSTDKLTGTGTNPTLTAVLNSIGNPLSPTLTGVETIKVTAIGTAAATLNLVNSSAEKTLINDASTQQLTFKNVDLTKDTKVVANQTTFATTVNFKDLSSTTDTVTVELNNAAAGVALVGETGAVGSIETVNVVANGDILFASGFVGGGALGTTTTINLTGGASVNTLALTVGTFDASKATGNITTALAGGTQTFSTGTGADFVRVDALGTSKISTGAGNDRVFMGTFLDAKDTLDGGDGRDTLQVTTGLGASKLAVANFEVLRIADLSTAGTGLGSGVAVNGGAYDLSLLDGSKIDTVQVGFTTGTTTIKNLLSGNKIALQGEQGFNSVGRGVGDVVVEVKDAAATVPDTLNIDIGRVASAGTATGNIEGTAALTVNSLTANDVENFNINSAGSNSANTINALAGSALTKLVITGDDALTIGGTTGGTTLVSVDASGFQGALKAAFGPGAGSGTGANQITGVVINTGSGADDITAGNRIDRVNLGDGNDTYSSDNFPNIGGDIITTGNGSDTIRFTFRDQGGTTFGQADTQTGHRITDFTLGNGGDILQINQTNFVLDGGRVTDTGNGVAAAGATNGDVIVLTGQSFANYAAASAWLKAAHGGVDLTNILVLYRDSGAGAVKAVWDNTTANNAGEIAVVTLENVTTVGQFSAWTDANLTLV